MFAASVVNVPAAGVIDPIIVLSIDPPLIVRLSATSLSAHGLTVFDPVAVIVSETFRCATFSDNAASLTIPVGPMVSVSETSLSAHGFAVLVQFPVMVSAAF